MLRPLVAQSCDLFAPLLSIDHMGHATTFAQVETRLYVMCNDVAFSIQDFQVCFDFFAKHLCGL